MLGDGLFTTRVLVNISTMDNLYHGYEGQQNMLKTSVRISIYIVSRVLGARVHKIRAHTRTHSFSLIPAFSCLVVLYLSSLSLREKCIMQDGLNDYRKFQLHDRIMK